MAVRRALREKAIYNHAFGLLALKIVAAHHPRSELVAFMASSLGEKVAEETVLKFAAELKLHPDRFTMEEAMALFERVAQEPGLVGIAGRFARTRCILGWGMKR